MKKKLWLLPLAFGLVVSVNAQDVKPPVATTATDSTKKPAAPAKPSIADKIKSSRKIDGMFTFYQDTVTGSLQMYVKKDQLGKDYIYQSFSLSGPTSMYLNQNMIRTTMVFHIQNVNDKLEFLQKNTAFYYDPSNPVSKAANVDVAEALFYADKIAAKDDKGYLIAVDGLFLGDKLDQVKPTPSPGMPPGAMFTLGNLNPAKSKYQAVKSFSKNTDVQVDLAYDNPMALNGGGKDITDARFVRVKMQHSFLEMPNNKFRPRRDDPRVGYFGAEVENLTSLSVTPYKDFISRWNLVKKDPSAKLSEPVEPIVFWIENTTPLEYRPIIKESGEKWNEAFEKAGFKNAVVMKQMPDNATWDPADVNYNVIRWVSSMYPPYGAIGPSFFNPYTGQILGADITVEWKSGAGALIQDDLYNGYSGAAKVALPWENPEAAMQPNHDHFSVSKAHLNCNLAAELNMQYNAALTTVDVLDADLAPAVREEKVKELHKQFLYYLIMHEMGHTLGLNHNMKASQMLSPAQLHDTKITRKIGLQGSVMDYPSINVSLDRKKQGDYYTTKAGPYDIWAIEYGYTPFSPAEEEAGLNKILARSTDPQLTFGNDADDMRSPGKGIDPRVNVNDHSNDMVTYAEDRFKLVNTMIPKLKTRYSKPDQSYQELRTRYLQLHRQRADMANALSRYIGGVYVDRSYPGQKPTVAPYTPVPADYQKKALNLINTYVFAPNVVDADKDLYPYLQVQRRGFNFMSGSEDFKPQTTVLSYQTAVLAHLLHPTTLTRISNSALYGNEYALSDVMKDITNGIFAADLNGSVNIYRQNLQTEYVKALGSILNAPGATYDNASKGVALSTLNSIKSQLKSNIGDGNTKAHREGLVYLIEKATVIK
ncbi:MAG: DUF5117 domain-containing protein [Pedobacter sp.]|nr:MAG: DUF5117 domain-containing protein [Pedobacter sp.]